MARNSKFQVLKDKAGNMGNDERKSLWKRRLFFMGVCERYVTNVFVLKDLRIKKRDVF